MNYPLPFNDDPLIEDEIDAIVISDGTSLTCHSFVNGDDTYRFEQMTIQRGHEQVVKRFAPNSAEVQACLDFLQQRTTARNVGIGLVHLLHEPHNNGITEDFRAHLPSALRQRGGRLHTYRVNDGILRAFGTVFTYHAPQREKRKTARAVSAVMLKQDLQNKEVSFLEEISNCSPRNAGGAKLSLTEGDDIPAEFLHVIWKAHPGRPSTVSDTNEPVNSPAHSVSTWELAAWSGGNVDSLPDLVHFYQRLRRLEGSLFSVPMVGFKASYLHAVPYLQGYTRDTDLCMTPTQLMRLEGTWATITPALRNIGRSENPLVRAGARCLESSVEEGLPFFSLCQDIVYSLSGAQFFILSLSDALRIFHALLPYKLGVEKIL